MKQNRVTLADQAILTFSHLFQQIVFSSEIHGLLPLHKEEKLKRELASDTLLPVIKEDGSNLNIISCVPPGTTIPLNT